MIFRILWDLESNAPILQILVLLEEKAQVGRQLHLSQSFSDNNRSVRWSPAGTLCFFQQTCCEPALKCILCTHVFTLCRFLRLERGRPFILKYILPYECLSTMSFGTVQWAHGILISQEVAQSTYLTIPETQETRGLLWGNIAKGTTDPRAEFTVHSSQILIKLQIQNLN